MIKVLLPVTFAAIALVTFGCIGLQQTDLQTDSPEHLSEEEIAVLISEPNTVDWEYPIQPKVWYPGDEYHAEECFTYYTQRCWPGCHDPNSRPRPAKY